MLKVNPNLKNINLKETKNNVSSSQSFDQIFEHSCALSGKINPHIWGFTGIYRPKY
jgi:hypothetical protein